MADSDLYSTYAKDFSDTRQAPWPGWERVVKNPELNQFKDSLRILDLGCGNGRFLKYLVQNPQYKIESYLGIDNSDILLNIAKKDLVGLENVEFKKSDLNNPNWQVEIQGTFNLITAFGIIHHIDSFENRKNILQYSSNLLEPKGILVLAYWQFEGKDRYKNKLSPRTAGTTQTDKWSSHDYTMTFGNHKATRFVHNCTKEEVLELEEGTDFEVIDSFYSDGKEGDQNLYRILQAK